MLTKEMILNLSLNTLGFVGATDLESRVIWTTHMFSEIYNYKNANDLIGLKYNEIKCIEKYYRTYELNNKTVMLTGGTIFIEPVSIYGHIAQSITTKIPLYDVKNNIAGVYFAATLVNSNATLNLINSIQHSLTSVYGGNKPQLQVPLKTLKHQLTLREQEVLFYTLRGKSAKSIAQCLVLSSRTVESHLENIKTKFSCYTKQQLIDAAIAEGYMAMVPSTILQQPHKF